MADLDPTMKAKLGAALAAALDGDEVPLGGLLTASSPARALTWRPPEPDPREVHRAEAKRRLAIAFDDAVHGVGPEGGALNIRRTATVAELEEEAREKHEAAAAAKRADAALAESKALQAKADALEKRIAVAQREERNEQVVALMKERAARKGRSQPTPKDRRWAVRKLARSGR